MIFAAILAGGIGTRLKTDLPKQFIKINNKPLLYYSINEFLKVNEFDKIIVSSPKKYLNKTREIVNDYFKNIEKIIVIEGGKTRNDTILNSIKCAIKYGACDESIMVTHDGARIFVSKELIENSIKYAKKYGAASPVIPATDVIFQSKEKGKLNHIPQRKFLYHAQTPQAFNIYEFLKIYDTLIDEEINRLDEAMMLFYLGDKEVYLFEGDSKNFKITRPFDIELASYLIEN